MTRALLLTMFVVAATPARARESCAIVVTTQPEPDDAALDKVRQSFATRCQFVSSPDVQAALERFDRRPLFEEQARDALAQAHARMRRFDVAGVREALDEARRAIGELMATSEARQLFVQWALQAVELATVVHDAAGQLHAMQLALSVEPKLELDATRNPPTMLALLAAARRQLAREPRVSVRVSSEPADASVWASGWRGETPVTVELAAGPAVVWLSRAGHHSRILEIVAGSDPELRAELEPLAPAERLRPAVDAVRQAPPEARRQPALALAAAAGVDGVVIVEPDGSATLVDVQPLPPPVVPSAPPAAARATLVATAPSSPHRPWYKKAWPWVLLGGATAAAATVISVGVVYGSSSPASLSCCR